MIESERDVYMMIKQSIDSAFGKTMRSSKYSHCSIFSKAKKTGLGSDGSQLRMRESKRDVILEIFMAMLAFVPSISDLEYGL